MKKLARDLKVGKVRVVDAVILLAALCGVWLFLSGHKHNDDSAAGVAPVAAHDCSNIPSQNVMLAIDEAGFHPNPVQAKLCDTLIITNTGSRLHQPAVGPHPYHTALPGLEAKSPLRPNQTFSYALNRPGTYPLHDHINTSIQGSITIADQQK